MIQLLLVDRCHRSRINRYPNTVAVCWQQCIKCVHLHSPNAPMPVAQSNMCKVSARPRAGGHSPQILQVCLCVCLSQPCRSRQMFEFQKLAACRTIYTSELKSNHSAFWKSDWSISHHACASHVSSIAVLDVSFAGHNQTSIGCCRQRTP